METEYRPLIPWFYYGKKVTSVNDIFQWTIKYFPSLASTIKNNNYTEFDLYGFIYEFALIDPETNKDYLYIGKKNFYETKTLAVRRNKLPRPGHIEFKRKIRKHKKIEVEVFKKESNWLLYNSSSELVSKHIIDIAFSKMYLTYLEAKYLFKNEVLENEVFLNENILGKFFKGKLHTNEECIIYEQNYTSTL